MVVYVAHKYGGLEENVDMAKKIVHDLQIADTKNTYICPLLALSGLKYGELDWITEMELCLDLLSICDKLVVASDVSRGVECEIEFAKMVDMEVEYLTYD